MKKIFSLIFIMLFGLVLFGCKKTDKLAGQKLKIVAPQGTPTFILGSLLENKNYDFTLVDGPTPLIAELQKGEKDVIVASVLAGTKLNSLGKSKYKLASVVTKNNFILVSKPSVSLNSLSDLNNKTLGAYAQNNIPDIVLSQILKEKKITIKGEIKYANSISSVIPELLLAKDAQDVVLAGEPIISKLEEKTGKTFNKLDLSNVFQEKGYEVYQAGIFVKENSEAVKKFLKNVEASVNEILANPDKYSDKPLSLDSEKYPIFKNFGKKVLVKTLNKNGVCYLPVIDESVKTKILSFLKFIKDNDSTGKVLPKEITDNQFLK